jgi:hypothetical protein
VDSTAHIAAALDWVMDVNRATPSVVKGAARPMKEAVVMQRSFAVKQAFCPLRIVWILH